MFVAFILLVFFIKELKWNYLRNFNVLIADKKKRGKKKMTCTFWVPSGQINRPNLGHVFAHVHTLCIRRFQSVIEHVYDAAAV